jgi:hypothetical protein
MRGKQIGNKVMHQVSTVKKRSRQQERTCSSSLVDKYNGEKKTVYKMNFAEGFGQ